MSTRLGFITMADNLRAAIGISFIDVILSEAKNLAFEALRVRSRFFASLRMTEEEAGDDANRAHSIGG